MLILLVDFNTADLHHRAVHMIKKEGFTMKVGIIAALDFEVDLLKDSIEAPVIEQIAGADYHCGRIGDNEVVVVKCGVGKVSAAACTQAMITAYNPDIIINTGCAGALTDNLTVGDFVVANKTVEWDLDTTEFGNPRGYVYAMDKVTMYPNRRLADRIYQILAEKENVVQGLIASGDQFVYRHDQRAQILQAFPNALCVEMEGAAVGHVCEQNEVPFCIIRCMSNASNKDSSFNYEHFAAAVSIKTAAYLLVLLKSVNMPQ